jgi:putative transposase
VNRHYRADGDYAVKKDTMKTPVDVADEKLFDNWFDPVETELRTKVRGLIEAMIEDELETALARPRYGRRSGLPVGDDVGALATGTVGEYAR